MPKNLIFLTGYPRSRTCWFSELLTVRGFSFAFHEANLIHNFGVASLRHWKEIIESRPENNIIDCNSSVLLSMHYPEFKELFSNYKIVLVQRDEFEAKFSYRKFISNIPKFRDLDINAIWKIINNNLQLLTECVTIPYHKVSNEKYCKEFVDKFISDFPWDTQRFNELCKKNIVQNVRAIQ